MDAFLAAAFDFGLALFVKQLGVDGQVAISLEVLLWLSGEFFDDREVLLGELRLEVSQQLEDGILDSECSLLPNCLLLGGLEACWVHCNLWILVAGNDAGGNLQVILTKDLPLVVVLGETLRIVDEVFERVQIKTQIHANELLHLLEVDVVAKVVAAEELVLRPVLLETLLQLGELVDPLEDVSLLGLEVICLDQLQVDLLAQFRDRLLL